MRLFDFVEEEHGIGAAAHGFGQKTALFAVGVAGRRADQALRHVTLHELTHVQPSQRLIVVE